MREGERERERERAGAPQVPVLSLQASRLILGGSFCSETLQGFQGLGRVGDRESGMMRQTDFLENVTLKVFRFRFGFCMPPYANMR